MKFLFFQHLSNIFLCLTLATLVSCSHLQIPAPPPEPVQKTAEIPTLYASSEILHILHPQAPDILNPHLSSAMKDIEVSRITYEPLASFDHNGNLVPFLAEEIPSLQNGGVAPDGKSVTWKLKQGILWSDGTPFTAADVVFTYQFITNPEVNAASLPIYNGIENVIAVDDATVSIFFKYVTPAWYVPFVGMRGVILPQHHFEAYNNANAYKAPANILPVGTGPYRAMAPGLKPQEVLLLQSSLVRTNIVIFEPNPYYRTQDNTLINRVEFRGGGKPEEAARSLENGEVDFIYDVGLLTLEHLQALDNQSLLITSFGSNVFRILLNLTEPGTETSAGERSSTSTPHRFLSDLRVRQAFSYAIDRAAIAALFGSFGRLVNNNLVTPPQFNSTNNIIPYDPHQARQLLEDAGWTLAGNDKVRQKAGEKLQVVLQSYSGSELILQNLHIIKANLEAIGVEVELKLKDPSIMFGPCVSNPDSVWCFNADMMYLYINMAGPDPDAYLQNWTCQNIPQSSNNWTGINLEGYCNTHYDTLYQIQKNETDPIKRSQTIIMMNDLLIQDVVMIPTVLYADVLGVNPNITGIEPTPWDAYTWNIANWRRVP